MPAMPVQRLLILDDDEIMRGVLEAMLAVEEFEVTLAQGGEEALQLLRDGFHFNVILSDIHMPGLQGAQLAQSLRDSVSRSTVLLGMSASPPADDIREAFDGFLLKPFGVQLLRDAIAGSRTRPDAISQKVTATQAPLPASLEVLDEKNFGSLLKMIPQAQLGELFTMALKDIEKRHGHMVLAAREGDLATVQREAHAIKGACGMLGALELQALASALETGDKLEVSTLEAIPEACHRLRRVLESKV